MAKAIIIKKNGGPEVLELQDVKVGAPGPDEIKVTNYAIGLNYIDTYHRSGLYPLKLPSGIGLEAAGKVEEIGSNVKEFNIGGKYKILIAEPDGNFVKKLRSEGAYDISFQSTYMKKGRIGYSIQAILPLEKREFFSVLQCVKKSRHYRI